MFMTWKLDELTGAAQCLGDLYRSYGRKITSGMVETSNIVTKMMKFPEVMLSYFLASYLFGVMIFIKVNLVKEADFFIYR